MRTNQRGTTQATVDRNPSERQFCLRMPDDSLIGDGISKGDSLIAQFGDRFKRGKIYILRLQNEIVARHAYMEGENVRLVATNGQPEMIVPENQIEFMGRVVFSGTWRTLLKCPYRDSERVCGPRAEWIAYMLRDMGVKDDDVDKRVREAVTKYIAELVDDENDEPCALTMGELEIMVSRFWHGYEEALIDSGALKSPCDGG